MYKLGDQCILSIDTEEYQNMKKCCDILNKNSPHKHIYTIKNVYLDFGQNWIWTTIIDTTEKYQILSSKMWLDIVNGVKPEDIVNEFFNNGNSLEK